MIPDDTVPVLAGRLMVDDFLVLITHSPYTDQRYELMDGAIIPMPPSTTINSVLAVWIGAAVVQFVHAGRLGFVTGADGGYRLDEHTYVQPDIGFISRQRAGEHGTLFPVAPDFAIEIVSPSEDILGKAQRYLEAGTKMVWAVYAAERLVRTFTQAADGGMHIRQFRAPEQVSAGDALPGFTLAVEYVFAIVNTEDNASETAER